jgi:hypothetical protein
VHDNLFLDKGWRQDKVNDKLVWYKGYSTDCRLSDNLNSIIEGYQPRGIWCVITYHNQKYDVYHALLRGFPINQTRTTNLFGNEKNPEIDVPEISEPKTFDEVVDGVISILSKNCLDFVKYNDEPLNIWCTGGRDSMLLLAICEREKIPYNFYTHDKPKNRKIHKECDIKLSEHISTQYPNYAPVSIFSEPTVLLTGHQGDNFMCRLSSTIKLLANSIGKTPRDLIKPNQYSGFHMSTSVFSHLSESITKVNDVKHEIMMEIIGGHNVWHIDNTITFTPFYDVELPKLILSLDVETLIDAGLNGSIQLRAIEKCCPEIKILLQPQKNTVHGHNIMLTNLKKVNLGCCKKIYIV